MSFFQQLLAPERKLSNLRDPDQWLVDWVHGGPETVSGLRVTPNSALGLATYFAAMRVLSEDVAKVPFRVFSKSKRGRNKRQEVDHPVFVLLNDSPNSLMSTMSLRETMTAHALGWGNGYAEIVREFEQPKALQIIEPNRVRPEIGDDGVLRYNVTNGRGMPDVVLPAENMFHLHGLGFDGITGYSIARIARETIGAGLAEVQSGASLFGNDSRPSGVLQTAHRLDTEARKALRDGWERIHGGVRNSNKTAVLDQDVKFSTISMPSKDAQWIESKQHTVEEIARWFRVSPHKVQHLLRATFDNIEMLNIEHLTDALLPWYVRWEQEAKRKLLNLRADREKRLFAEHSVEGVLRGDIEKRFKAFATARQWGWMSANDILALENRNGIGPQGDIYLVPMNMVPAKDLLAPAEDRQPDPEPPQPPVDGDADEPDEQNPALQVIVADEVRRLARDAAGVSETIDGIVEAHTPLFADLFAKLHRSETKIIESHRKKPGFDGWLKRFHVEHAAHVRSTVASAVDAFSASVWSLARGGEMPNAIQRLVENEEEDYSQDHVESVIAYCYPPNRGLLERVTGILRDVLVP